MRAELAVALMLLTRLPGAWLIGTGAVPAPGRAVWAFPVIGAAAGGIGAAVLWLGALAGAPSAVGAGLALAALVLVTGGLHEDGLADMADGFGGGRDVSAKLAIMRDSRIGSYGVLALLLTTGLRWSALAGASGAAGGTAVAAACVLSRASMLGPLTLRPARADGLGAGVGRIPVVSAAACILIAATACWSLLDASWALAAFVAACGVSAGVRGIAHRQIGGFTGDVAGACAVLTETAVLSVLSCRG